MEFYTRRGVVTQQCGTKEDAGEKNQRRGGSRFLSLLVDRQDIGNFDAPVRARDRG